MINIWWCISWYWLSGATRGRWWNPNTLWKTNFLKTVWNHLMEQRIQQQSGHMIHNVAEFTNPQEALKKPALLLGVHPHHHWSPWPWHVRFQLPRLPICRFRQLSFLKNLRSAQLCWPKGKDPKIATTIFNHPEACCFAQQGKGGKDVRTLIDYEGKFKHELL